MNLGGWTNSAFCICISINSSGIMSLQDTIRIIFIPCNDHWHFYMTCRGKLQCIRRNNKRYSRNYFILCGTRIFWNKFNTVLCVYESCGAYSNHSLKFRYCLWKMYADSAYSFGIILKCSEELIDTICYLSHLVSYTVFVDASDIMFLRRSSFHMALCRLDNPKWRIILEEAVGRCFYAWICFMKYCCCVNLISPSLELFLNSEKCFSCICEIIHKKDSWFFSFSGNISFWKSWSCIEVAKLHISSLFLCAIGIRMKIPKRFPESICYMCTDRYSSLWHRHDSIIVLSWVLDFFCKLFGKSWIVMIGEVDPWYTTIFSFRFPVFSYNQSSSCS